MQTFEYHGTYPVHNPPGLLFANICLGSHVYTQKWGLNSGAHQSYRNHVLDISDGRKVVIFVFQLIFKDMKEEDQHTKIYRLHIVL